jgi:hypothetical protein
MRLTTVLIGLAAAAAAANAGATSGATGPSAGVAARRSEPAKITCLGETGRSVVLVPQNGLEGAIQAGTCTVDNEVLCAGITASQAFQNATNCGEHQDLLEDFISGGSFEAEYVDASPPSPSIDDTPEVTPSASTKPQQDPPSQIVVQCKEGEHASLTVESNDWHDSIAVHQKCILEEPDCFDERGDTANAKDVAKDALNCFDDVGRYIFLKGAKFNATITIEQEESLAPTPSKPSASQSDDIVIKTILPTTTPSPAVLTDAEIIGILGEGVDDSLVETARKKVLGCDKNDAILKLGAAVSESHIDYFSRAFSGARDLKDAVEEIDCSTSNRRDSNMNGIGSLDAVNRKVNEGSIIGMATIVGGVSAVALCGVLGRYLYNRQGSSFTVTGNTNYAQATLGNAAAATLKSRGESQA